VRDCARIEALALLFSCATSILKSVLNNEKLQRRHGYQHHRDIYRVIVLCVVVVVLILVFIAVTIVLLLRYRRRRKRHLTRQQTATAGDDAFHPYIVDDAATHKLSCADHSQDGAVCQVSCASDNSMSQRQPTSPNRPPSYALSTLDNVMPGHEVSGESMARACDYGSNADELQNVGRQPDGSHSPEFVGRSPAITAKRFMPPVSANNGEASKGLNNLNKAENYRKKSKCQVLYKPSAHKM